MSVRTSTACLLALAFICAPLAACGSSSSSPSGASSVASTGPRRLPKDVEGDNDNPGQGRYDADDGPTLTLGHVASPAERRELSAVVRAYYTAAAAGEGARACRLLYGLLEETVAEQYGESAGAQVHGKTCAQVLTTMFRGRHAELARRHATIRIETIRLDSRRAQVLLSFTGAFDRRVEMRSEGGAWKMDDLFDLPVP